MKRSTCRHCCLNRVRSHIKLMFKVTDMAFHIRSDKHGRTIAKRGYPTSIKVTPQVTVKACFHPESYYSSCTLLTASILSASFHFLRLLLPCTLTPLHVETSETGERESYRFTVDVEQVLLLVGIQSIDALVEGRAPVEEVRQRHDDRHSCKGWQTETNNLYGCASVMIDTTTTTTLRLR